MNMYSSKKSGSIIDLKNKQKDLKIVQIIKPNYQRFLITKRLILINLDQ